MPKKLFVFIFILLVLIFLLSKGFQLRNSILPNWKAFDIHNKNNKFNETHSPRISQWMTFDYINKVFNLPNEYLKIELNINDTSYPFITVKHYSIKENLDINVVVKKIQEIIISYLKNNPAK